MRHVDIVLLIRDGLEEAMPDFKAWRTYGGDLGECIGCYSPAGQLYTIGIELDIALVKRALRNKMSVPLVIASRQGVHVPFPADPTLAALTYWLKHN